MRRLSATDSLFLSLETSQLPMQVGGLVTLDTTSAPDFGFDRVRELYARRIARVPKLTWRLKEVPLRLDRPLWMDGGQLDIDQHLERVAVPAPGGPREVAEVVGRLFSQPLDRGLPLWRMWYLDGVADGTAALFSAHHHCLMDGTAGANLDAIMFDLKPNPNPEPELPHPVAGPGGRDPSDLEQLLRSGLSLLATPVKLPGFVGAYAKRVARMVPDVIKHGVPSAMLSPAPRTSFNRVVGARRVLAFASLSLADLKAVRKQLDVTVNDVIVAVCTDALERYLRRIGEGVPERPLTVAVPVSTRAPGDDELTNRVSVFPISVATDMVGPVEHLHAIFAGDRTGQAAGRSVRGEPAALLRRAHVAGPVGRCRAGNDPPLSVDAGRHEHHGLHRQRSTLSPLRRGRPCHRHLPHEHRVSEHGDQLHGDQLRLPGRHRHHGRPRSRARPLARR